MQDLGGGEITLGAAQALAEDPATKRGVLSELSCGAFGGLCAALATHPLDTIKTRMQSGPAGTTFASSARATVQRDGVRGFYRGITVPVVSQPLYVGASFAGLQAGYFLWDRHYQPSGIATESNATNAALRLAFGGALGGAACAVAVTPGERLKVLLQTQGQGGAVTQTPLQTVRSVVIAGGWSSLFVGLRATLLREVPGTIMWFGAFEATTSYAERRLELSRPKAVLCGAVAAGLTFWLPVIPIDTIKTRQQAATSGESNGAMDIARKILRTRGIGGFWAGLTPILARGILLDIFQFSGADQLRNMQASLSQSKTHM